MPEQDPLVHTEVGQSLATDVVNVLHNALEGRFGATHLIVKRALRPSDPAMSIGVFLDDWNTDERSQEIGGIEPTLSRYWFSIQNMILASDEEAGRQAFAGVAKMIRVTLYRDHPLAVALREIKDTSLGSIERVQRVGVARQRFATGVVRGNWNFVCTTRLWVEVDINPSLP